MAGGEKTFKHPRLLGTDMYCPVLDVTTLYNWSQPAKPTLVLTSSSDYDNIERVLLSDLSRGGKKKVQGDINGISNMNIQHYVGINENGVGWCCCTHLCVYVLLGARFTIVDCPTQQTRIFMRTYETLTPVLLQNLLWYFNAHFKANYFGRGENSQKPNVIFFLQNL